MTRSIFEDRRLSWRQRPMLSVEGGTFTAVAVRSELVTAVVPLSDPKRFADDLRGLFSGQHNWFVAATPATDEHRRRFVTVSVRDSLKRITIQVDGGTVPVIGVNLSREDALRLADSLDA